MAINIIMTVVIALLAFMWTSKSAANFLVKFLLFALAASSTVQLLYVAGFIINVK